MHSPCALQDLSGEGEGDRHVARACLSVRARLALPAEPHPPLRASRAARCAAGRLFARTKESACTDERFHRCKGCQVGRSIMRSLPSPPFLLPSAVQQCTAANTLEGAIPPTRTNAHQHTSTPACIRSCQGHTLSRCGQHAIARLAVGLGHCGDWRCPSRERKGWRTEGPVRFVV
jgi:hypothetical protein